MIANTQDKMNIYKVIDKARLYIKNEDSINLILKAYDVAYHQHLGQFRKSGDPYVIHALWVAYILCDLQVEPSVVAAGLLHDVIEDCEITAPELELQFGEEIVTLVESVTKLGKVKMTNDEDYLAENQRRLFIAMSKDVRVILIKLADRLHNMRTLKYMKPEKQIKISRETLDIYAPIAHRMGMSKIKAELEDRCLFYLDPDMYKEIAKRLADQQASRTETIDHMIADISKLLDEYRIVHRIFGRLKNIYSIYKKIKTKGKRFEEIYDLQAIRIICNQEMDCYGILGLIHNRYRPLPGRFKDYIAMPKPNLYQSLHTTIIGENENIFEVQIRTEEMDLIAEGGIAAHWQYKEGIDAKTNQREIEEKLHWFKDFISMTSEAQNQDHEAKDYMKNLMVEIFEANVYVLTPKGRVISLPSGGTAIDFAYKIHSKLAEKMNGVVINGKIAPLNRELATGDVVEIKTVNNAAGPNDDWLKFAKTSSARQRIKQFIKLKNQDLHKQDILRGKEILISEIERRQLKDKDVMTSKNIEMLLKNLSLSSIDDVYFAIANKGISAQNIIDRLVQDNTKNQTELKIRLSTEKKSISKNDVVIEGISGVPIELAACCSPIPGDEIVGIVLSGKGIKIHRTDCRNIINYEPKSKLIYVEWNYVVSNHKKYTAELQVFSYDRNFLLSDIVHVISSQRLSLMHIDSKVSNDGEILITKLRVQISNKEDLDVFISNLSKIPDVYEIIRVNK